MTSGERHDDHDASAEAAVRTVVTRDRAQWVALARRHGRGAIDPEDAAQRAMLLAIERARQLRQPHRAAAWVARIVRNSAQDALRRLSHSVETDPETLEAPTPEVSCDCIFAQLDAIGARDASLLRRVVLDGAPVATAAAELKITPNAAMIRLHRARKALRAQLASRCGTTSVAGCSSCGCAPAIAS